MSITVARGKWYYRFKVRGETYQASTGLEATQRNLNAAKGIEAQRRVEVLTGIERITGDGLTFPIAASEFLAWCHGTGYRDHPNSAKRISGSFASLNEFFADHLVVDIEAIDIERYKTYRATVHHVKDCTIRNDLNALSLFFGYAAKAKWRTGNPLLAREKHERVERPSNEAAVRIHVITPEEEAAYFSAAECRTTYIYVRDLAKLMLLQGMRPEEMLRARVADFNEQAGELRIVYGKTPAARRTLYLTGEAIEILARRKRESKALKSEWLFPSPRVKGRHLVKLNNAHDSLCQDAQVCFVLYDFRHTFATRQLIEAKTDTFSLAAIMGHSSPRLLAKYVHPSADHQRAAMKAYEAMRPRKALRKVKG